MRFRPIFILFVYLISIVSPSTSEAQKFQALKQNPLMKQGLVLYNDQKFSEAILIFERAFRWPKSNKASKIGALKYLAFCHIILRKKENAKAAFWKLLKIKPEFQLDGLTAPKFVRFFNKVRLEFISHHKVHIVDKNPKDYPIGRALNMRFLVKDQMKRMKTLELWFRKEGETKYSKALLQENSKGKWKELKPASSQPTNAKKIPELATKAKKQASIAATERFYQFTLPASDEKEIQQAYFLEYYLIAKGPTGMTVALLGAISLPQKIKRTFALADKKEIAAAPIYKKWWFWTAVGVVVVGGTTAAIVATSGGGKPAAPTTGSVVITVFR